MFAGGVTLGVKKDELFQRIRYGSGSQNAQLKASLDYAGVEEIYADLKQSFDGNLDQTKLEDGLKEGLVEAAGDPFTEYLNAEATEEFEEGLNGSFEGIGAELGKDEQAIVIISPIEGFPAQKAGLKAKDIISEIDGQSAFDLSVSEAVKKIRGEKGTKVKLGIIRDGKQLEFEIIRSQINIPSVESKMLENKIGLIEISRFGDDTTQLTRKAAVELKEQGARAVILDLRGNPGGLLNSSVEVASLWLPTGTKILEEKRGEKTVKTFNAIGTPTLLNMPTAVLINEGSASASEIVAGALADNKVATTVGEKTFGKGSVQEVIPQKDGGSLKVTIARWFTPGGRNIDKEGIAPEKEIKLSDADRAAQRDPQLEAAKKILN